MYTYVTVHSFDMLIIIQCIKEGKERMSPSTFVTRPAKINHVDTFKYLRNTNLKYSMPHNSPVPDNSCARFTLEVQQGSS